jgi:hypothetical protein
MASNPLNSSNTPPVNTGVTPSNSPAQDSIVDAFRQSRLPFSQHPALRDGVAGNTRISNPLPPAPSQRPARG